MIKISDTGPETEGALASNLFRNYLLANNASVMHEIIDCPETFIIHANKCGVGFADAFRDFYHSIDKANRQALENGGKSISLTIKFEGDKVVKV